MTTVATLTYDQYLKLVFDVYNESYSGTYPNIRYTANVRARFEGQFAMETSNTLRFGNLSRTYYMSYGYWTSASAWYELGTISQSMPVARQATFSYSCSCNGWPSLSGTAWRTTPTISLPTYTISPGDILQTSIGLNWAFSSNPNGLYALRIYNVTKGKYISNGLSGASGVVTDTGLTANTTYSYRVEAWLADLSGSALSSQTISATTLLSYPVLTVTGVDISREIGTNINTVTFKLHSSADNYISKTVWQLDGGPKTEISGTTYTESLAKGVNFTGTVYIVDTLGRSSAKYTFIFNTGFIKREVYAFNHGEWVWLRGSSYLLEENLPANINTPNCELWVFNGTEWKVARPYQEPRTLKFNFGIKEGL